MKRFANSLAILVLLAGIAFAAAPAFRGGGSVASAAQGSVTFRAVVLPPAGTYLPLTGLQAHAEGYVIVVNWTNPPASYSGSLIEWQSGRVRQGTSEDKSWYRSETFYPPAGWARLAAPMGARYTIRGSACYYGDATQSIPATASVVLTAPVEVVATLPGSGYAASASLRARYGNAPYENQFNALLEVPGGAVNHSMGSNPISWSPQLVGGLDVKAYRLETKTVMVGSERRTTGTYWKRVPDRPDGGVKWDETLPVRARPTFTDGYPATAGYAFSATKPGVYKVVMAGELDEGFAYQGSRSFSATRYITLKSTAAKPSLTTPAVGSPRSHRKKIKFTGAVSPAHTARVKVSIQRRLRGRWRAYKTVTVTAQPTGSWAAKTRVKKAGLFRVRTAVSATVAGPYYELTSATSRWRSFRVR